MASLFCLSGCIFVALRKESVDRNMLCTSVCFVCVGSLSARRAWIEIGISGVDKVSHQSLSARRAWIEIVFRGWTLNINGVALRKESVDRNRYWA